MLATFICLICLGVSFWAGRRSLVEGILTVIGVGYAYGILRANLHGPLAHFIFDAALLGLYASQPWYAAALGGSRTATLRMWTAALVVWPLIVCLLPFQTPLISLVGLRGNAFMIPTLLLGSRMKGDDWKRLAFGLVGLNAIALVFGTAQYSLGVERFFPESEVTATMYASNDVAGYRFLRIPSTFLSSAAFAGTMVMTFPLLYGAWAGERRGSWKWLTLLFAIGGSLIGVLMGASRSHFIVGAVLTVVAGFGKGMRSVERATWGVVIIGIVFLAVRNERFQRFQSLSDREMVASRIAGSVNRNFWEILFEYPLGNGLGGGGTSIPYFLQNQVRVPIQMENEYAKILLEQGLIGLVIWALFILWVFTRRVSFKSDPLQHARRIAWLCCLCYFGTGLIGTGLLTSIPQSFLLFLLVGWISVRPTSDHNLDPIQRHVVPFQSNVVRDDVGQMPPALI